MKIRVEITSGKVITKEVDNWYPYGDGMKGFDKDDKCIIYVPQEHLVSFEVINEVEENYIPPLPDPPDPSIQIKE